MTSLPPGAMGLPVIGETLPFLRDPFGFIAERLRTHGPVFKTRILAQNVVFIAGPEACERWLDEALITRAGSFPKPVLALFGGPSLPLLDGAEHRARKALVMAAFTPDALSAYLGAMDATIDGYLRRIAERPDIALVPELKRLAIETICGTMLGLPAGPELARLVDDYGVVMRGFTGLPIPLPGTTYGAALRARDRILSLYADQIRRHQAEASTDGLGRMLAARGPGGEALTLPQAQLELHHVVLAAGCRLRQAHHRDHHRPGQRSATALLDAARSSARRRGSAPRRSTIPRRWAALLPTSSMASGDGGGGKRRRLAGSPPTIVFGPGRRALRPPRLHRHPEA
ncbi:MAG: cytochrome P450 [Acidobacteriota bacterium]